MATICKGFVPITPQKLTSGSTVCSRFGEATGTALSNTDTCPENLLEAPKAAALNYWLSHFVIEARRGDGEPYPGSTIVNVLPGLYHYSRQCDKDCLNFMNRKDSHFRDLH